MQKIFATLFFGFLTVIALLVISNSQVRAISTNSSPNSLQKQALIDSRKLASTGALTNKATRASEFAQKACDVHVKVIKLRQNNIASHAQRVENRLNKLTLAVGKFYTDRLIPQGKVVANYDSLVADVSSKQAALIPLIEKVKTDSEGLSCEKDRQRAQFATFRQDWQSLLKAFKDYRLSVLNLMQAVKRAAGQSEGGEASSSADQN